MFASSYGGARKPWLYCRYRSRLSRGRQTRPSFGASDYLMFDLMRIGGVSGWLAASRIAADAGIRVSSHLYPEVSAHLLAATPTAHWLEYVDWAETFLEVPVTIAAGAIEVTDRPGCGLAWDDAVVARYAID